MGVGTRESIRRRATGVVTVWLARRLKYGCMKLSFPLVLPHLPPLLCASTAPFRFALGGPILSALRRQMWQHLHQHGRMQLYRRHVWMRV